MATAPKKDDLKAKFEAMYERYGTTGFGIMPVDNAPKEQK